MATSSQPNYPQTLPSGGRDVLVAAVRELRAWRGTAATQRVNAKSELDRNHYLLLGQRINAIADRLVALLGTTDAGGDQ